MFKKGFVATALLLGTLGSAHADTQTVVANIGKSETMANASIVVDTKMTKVLLDKVPSLDGYIVNVGGSRVLSNADGTIVSQLASVYITESMESLQTVINYEIMELKGNKDWFSMSLPEGVEKTGDVYVFSDPTCGYCRKMHTEKSKYDEYGIQMHIIPYPRQGLTEDNPGYTQWIEAACSANAGDAYHHIIMGEPVPKSIKGEVGDKAYCESRVVQGYNLGREVGLRGTPYVIAYGQNGERVMTPGYIPVDKLAESIGVSTSKLPQDIAVDSVK